VVASQPRPGRTDRGHRGSGGGQRVEGLAMLTAAQAGALERSSRWSPPELAGKRVFDSHGYMLALRGEIEDRGGSVVLSTPSRRRTRGSGGFRLRAGGPSTTSLTTAYPDTARAWASGRGHAHRRLSSSRHSQVASWQGSLFRPAGSAFQRLIYPRHRRGAGRPLPARPWRPGAVRAGSAGSSTTQTTASIRTRPRLRAYIRKSGRPGPDGALSPDYRPRHPSQADGSAEPQPDFRIDGPADHAWTVWSPCRIESPGLTSSLAIGEAVAARLGVFRRAPGLRPAPPTL